MMRAAGAAALVLAAVAAAQQASAQDLSSFSIERLRPASDRDGIIDVEWANIEAGPHEYDAAFLAGYELDPLLINLRNVDGTSERKGAIVAHKINSSIVAAYTLNRWLEFGGELPLVLFQTGGAPIDGLKLPPLAPAGVGDARLLAKLHVLAHERYGVDVAIIPALTLPTSFPRNNYLGESFATLVPEVAVSRELFGVRVAGNVGARFRPETDVFGLQVGHELTWRVGAAYRIPVFEGAEGSTEGVVAKPGPLEVQASLNGATSLLRPFKKINQQPMEFLGGVTYDAVPDLIQVFGDVGVGVVAGFGVPDARVVLGIRLSPREHDRDHDGIKDDVDQCPDEPEDKDGFEDSDGCPDPDNDGDGINDDQDRCPNVKGYAAQNGCLPGDSDGDGIADSKDKCPTEPEDKDEFQDEDGCPDKDNDDDGILDVDDKCPYDAEDKDGFEDADGCPDDDNDGDGIKDAKDKCPDVPEDMNGVEDDDGCPEKSKIIVTKKKVFTVDKIYFDTGKATIKRESFDVLDGVSKILKENPQLGAVRIEGHTDDRGSDDYNLHLSQDRCESVRKALISRGVPANKLEAKGFGEANPTYTNATSEGREKNRRVEFVFIGEGGAPAGEEHPPVPDKPAEPPPSDKPPDGTAPPPPPTTP